VGALDAKQKLIRDATAMRRANGQEPSTREDDTFWAAQLEEADRRDRDAKNRQPRKTRSSLARELSIRAVEKLRLGSEDFGNEGGALPASEKKLRWARARGVRRRRAVKQLPLKDKLELWQKRRRLRLLQLFPDWARKIRNAYDEGARAGARDIDGKLPIAAHQGLAITKVLDESNATFGDWRALRPRSAMSLPNVGKTVPGK
jgi:hypothetical protein